MLTSSRLRLLTLAVYRPLVNKTVLCCGRYVTSLGLRISSHRSSYSTIPVPINSLNPVPEHLSKSAMKPASEFEAVVAAQNKTYWKLLNELQAIRYRGWNVAGLVLLGIGCSVAAVASFGDEILDFFGKHTSTVAQVTITDPQVQKQVELLSKQVVQDLLQDQRTRLVATEFLQDLLSRPESRIAATELVLVVLNQDVVLQTAAEFSKKIVWQLAEDPVTIQKVAELLVNAVLTDTAKTGFASLIQHTFAQENMQSKAGDFIAAALTYESVHNKSAELTASVLQRLISDPIVIDNVARFAHNIIRDEKLQVQAGSAIWNAVAFSVTPAYFRSLLRPDASLRLPPMTEFESVLHIPVVQEDPDSKTTIIIEESAKTVSITGANSANDYTALTDHAVSSTLVLAPVASPTESAVAAAATVSWLVNRASDQLVTRSEFVEEINHVVDGTFETLEVNSTNDSIALDRPRHL